MEKDKLIEQMLKEKGNKNNSIDLDAYARGLIDMYDKLVLPQADVSKSFPLIDHHYFECESKGNCKAPSCYCKPKNKQR